jgi:thiamine-phosphate pyrophosphorylase
VEVTDPAAAVIESASSPRDSAGVRGLYAVTPDLADTPLIAAKVGAAIAGGAAVVQYRNKAASAALRREQAERLADICRQGDALFVVNDDARLARDVSADGVHLGEDDGSLAAVRALVGEAMLIGVSCYNAFDRAEAAVADGADYVAFGSFYPSRVKPGARRADVALLRAATALGVPVVAIGGITAANARALVEAGAGAVAVISDVFAHDEPAEIMRAAAAIAACFPSHPRSRRSP